MNNYFMMEHMAAISNLPVINSAIKVSGTWCTLLKINKYIDKDDSVYGIHAGSKELENDSIEVPTIIQNSPYGTMTRESENISDYDMDQTEDAFDSDVYMTDELDNDIDDLYEDDSNNYGNTANILATTPDRIEISVLIPSSVWRVISSSEYGYYDFDGYLWTNSTEVDVGDVLVINTPLGDSVRFKITRSESIGNNLIIATRFKLAGLG